MPAHHEVAVRQVQNELALPAGGHVAERRPDLSIGLRRGLLYSGRDRLRGVLQMSDHRRVARLELRGLIRRRATAAA